LGGVRGPSALDIGADLAVGSHAASVLGQVRIADGLRDLLIAPPARSNSATRASMSSISLALVANSITVSAARKRVPAGTFESNMIFNMVVTAAPEASCSRPIDCQNAARRASR
jgi:hypothetical protein